MKGAKGNQVLKIYVDIEGGIKLEQCVELSREISDILDIEDIMPGKYRLEVSSPGVDRPLKKQMDFRRNIGRTIKVNLIEGNSIEGNVKRVNDSTVYLENEDKEIEIPLSSIKLAKIILQW